jgi:WD40 repeat protein
VLSGDGRKLAAVESADGGRVVMWDLESGAGTVLDLEPSGWGWFFASPLLSHDGSELMLHGRGAGLTLFEVDYSRLDFQDSRGSSLGVALPSGWLAISEGEWFERPQTHRRQAALAAEQLVASPDGRFVGSAAPGSSRLWSPAQHLEIDRWVAPKGESIKAFTQDTVVTQVGYDTIRVYPRTDAGAATAIDTRHPDQQPLAFAANRPTRVAYEVDGHYEIHELGSASTLCRIDAHASEGQALSPDGLSFAVLDGAGGVQAWDVQTCRERERFALPEAKGEGEVQLRHGEDGSLRFRTRLGLNVIRSGQDRTIRIDEQCTTPDAGWSQLSPDGRMLLSCCNGRMPEHNPGRLWDVATGELIREFDLRGTTMQAQLSSDGRLILINAGQHEIAVLGIDDGRELFRVPGQLWSTEPAKTHEGEHGLVLDLATPDGLVTLPLSVPGLVAAACDVLARSELADRSALPCRR